MRRRYRNADECKVQADLSETRRSDRASGIHPAGIAKVSGDPAMLKLPSTFSIVTVPPTAVVPPCAGDAIVTCSLIEIALQG